MTTVTVEDRKEGSASTEAKPKQVIFPRNILGRFGDSEPVKAERKSVSAWELALNLPPKGTRSNRNLKGCVKG